MKPALLPAASLLALAIAAPAWAQQVDGDGGALEDIIVTAQKRDQRIVDVPVNVTAWSGDSLQRMGITQMNELSAFVPGLNIQEQSANNPGFVIRGITSDSGSAQEAARVTVYYNGVDVSRSRGSYFDLFDIQRVEVVKGPQATLFGTAAAIGAVSVIPNPVGDDVSGEIRGALGNFNQRMIAGHANIANEMLGLRVAFAWKKRDGVVENIAGGTPNGTVEQDDLNGQDQRGVRVSLKLDPEGPVRADLVYSYDGQRNPGTSFKSGTLNPYGGDTSPYSFAELGGSPYSKQVLGMEKLGLRRDVHDLNFTARYTPDDSPWSTVHIFGYREFNSLEVFDADGTGAWFLEFAEDARGSQFSHESRVNYEGERFRAFAGFNWFWEQGTQRVPFSTEEGTYIQCVLRVIPNVPCVDSNGVVTAAQATAMLTGGALQAIPYSSVYQNGGENELVSVFADASFDVTPWLELTAGGRLLWEVRRSSYFSDQPKSVLSQALIPGGISLLPFAGTNGQIFTARQTNNAFLPRFNALVRFSEGLNGYATVSKGRRSPVVQLNAEDTAGGPVAKRTDIPAETVWNYEGGVKASLGAFGGSLGIFYQTYDNFQVSVIEDGQAVTRNAGSATNFGVEAEANWRPSGYISLFANGAWINAKIDEKEANGQFGGNRFRLQPEWQAAAGADFRMPLGNDLSAFITPTLTYRSKIYFEVPNSEAISQGPVALVNLRAGFEGQGGRWQVTGFVSNLFDREYLIDAGNTGGSFGTPTFIRGNPRLGGVELAFRF
ncbi:TonB-dependent receptor [Sandaracinobacter sp. RS1-74]|uniref:TonB-dependent receptor n=1 Tax=Sandaracinobacteroides sayramensis TaxID=2913411 RepID=UPI001EDB611D|nr:TonB-dependent receptor [Sandaracinobacteroides sayramensis]MCG2841791.1 TonB-dependent receptor [Sandaracinobacteroides sayramensis]